MVINPPGGVIKYKEEAWLPLVAKMSGVMHKNILLLEAVKGNVRCDGLVVEMGGGGKMDVESPGSQAVSPSSPQPALFYRGQIYSFSHR